MTNQTYDCFALKGYALKPGQVLLDPLLKLTLEAVELSLTQGVEKALVHHRDTENTERLAIFVYLR